MSRVSENSNTLNVQYNLNRIKNKLDDMQLKGSTLKKMNKLSDNPINAMEVLAMKSRELDNKQFMNNIEHARLNLETSEKSLEELTEVVKKAKEIAISQSSDIYGEKIRKNIATQVIQLKNQALAIGNRRVGDRYLFSGYKSLSPPFDNKGNYLGDNGKIQLEIKRDLFVPINMTGTEVFFTKEESDKIEHPLEQFPDFFGDGKKEMKETEVKREEKFHKRNNIFGQLDLFIVGLENNDSNIIRNLLDDFDESVNRLISIRTEIGSLLGLLENSRSNIERTSINNAETKSRFVDADLAKIFSDITKQQQVLKSSYQTAKTTLNQNLIDFLR